MTALRPIAVLVFLVAAAPVRAETPIFVDAGQLPEQARAPLEALRPHGAVHVLTPVAAELPSRDALLADARHSYGTMAFRRAVAQLAQSEHRIADGARPTPQRSERLAEIELFYGACLLLDHDPRGAEERFVLARSLAPSLTVDPIFPPEVARAFQTAKPGAALNVTVAVAPEGARVWVDGNEGVPAQLAVGLHYAVAERADRRPSGSLVRVSKSAARVALAADIPASVDDALLALRTVREPTEGLAVSRLLGAVVWRLSAHDGEITAERFAATDAVHPTLTVEASISDGSALERAICAADTCDAKVAAGPRKPVWKRPWFWGVVGTGAALVVTGVIVGAVLGTRPRDYEVVVR